MPEGQKHNRRIIFLTAITAGMIKKLADGDGENMTSWVTPLRAGKFHDPRYDWFDIEVAQLYEMQKNFNANVVGLELPVLFGHYGPDNAAGWHKIVEADGNRLRVQIKWTPAGVEAIRNREFKYLSAEYDENYEDNETGTNRGCVYLGCALTNRPVQRNQDPVSLSRFGRDTGSDDEIRVVYHPDLEKHLSKNTPTEELEMKNWLKMFLAASGLPEEEQKKLAQELEKKIKEDAKEEDVFKLANEAITASRKALAKPKPEPATPAVVPEPEPANATPSPDPAKALSQDDVDNAVKKALTADRADQVKLSTARQDRIAAFTKKLTEQEGLDDDTRKSLAADHASFVTGDMDPAMIGSWETQAIKMAAGAIVKQKLLAEGFHVDGKIIVGEDTKKALAVCNFLDEKVLGIKSLSDAERFPGNGELTPRNKRLAEKALADFDKRHMAQLHAEGQKFLAGGPTGMGDTTIGTSLISVGRTLLREILYNLVATNFVAADVEGVNINTPTIYIPYVARELESDLLSALVRYQGQTIGRAQMTQSGETGYISPLKLATALYNEVLIFGPGANINYSPLQENLNACTRVIREAIDELLITEIVQSCDEYGATAVADEVLTAQCDNSNTTFQLGLNGFGVLTKFPLVKPRSVYDLTGTQVGSTLRPITMTYDGTAATEYNGTGDQDAGIYFKITDWALGQFQLVSEAGVVQTPAAAKVLVVNTYSYSTNRTLFDFYDATGSLTWEKHLNGLLRAFGRAGSAMAQDRYTQPEYALMSYTLNQYASEAEKWAPSLRIEGQSMTERGNASMVAGVPTFQTPSPASLLGAKRAIISRRDITTYKVTSPWSFETELKEMVDGTTGKFVGGKHTYGQQFHCIHTPGGPSGVLKGQATQVIAYDSRTNANGGDVGPF